MVATLPRWDIGQPVELRKTVLLHQIDRWIRTSSLQDLAGAFGASPPAAVTGDILAWFDEFSARQWDFRGGGERDSATRPVLTPQQQRAAARAAHDLGLATSSPPEFGDYSHCLILGGLVRACVTRPRFAAGLRDAGVDLGEVVALGGFRTLSESELDLAQSLGLQASNEFTAMDEGMRSSFDIDIRPVVHSNGGGVQNSDWRVHDYPEHSCAVMAAPSSEPETRRANSADTFRWWAARLRERASARILLITSPIYVPYQGAFATEILGIEFGIQVETIGISATAADLGAHTQAFDASNYLQEIRSGIRGMRSLWRKATADL